MVEGCGWMAEGFGYRVVGDVEARGFAAAVGERVGMEGAVMR